MCCGCPKGGSAANTRGTRNDLGNGWAGRQPPANALCSSGTDAAGEPMRKQARDSSSRCMGARNEGSRQACNKHVCRARAGCSPPSRCTQGCCMLIASWRGWCCWPVAWAAAPLHQREGAHKVMGGSGQQQGATRQPLHILFPCCLLAAYARSFSTPHLGAREA